MSNPAFTHSGAFNGKSQFRAPGYTETPYNPYGPYGTTASAAQLSAMYAAPSASPVDTGRMTYDDVLIKSVGMLAVMLVGATVGWLFTPAFPAMFYLCGIIGFVLGFVNALKREPSPVLITVYAICQGVFVGGVSMVYNSVWSGIVMQAVLATMAVFGITLALFASGKVRASGKFSRIVSIGLLAYLLYMLVNATLVWTGINQSMFGLDTSIEVFGIPLGAIIGPIVILMGAYCLVESFDFIKRGVESGAPAKYAWTAAFGLLLDLIFLYIQILRWLAILQRN
ncbi:MAG: Bax inhibitor-1/YccA family protein [Bifidobacteriaceae bacterium]|jgi:uncharacterized YccA/Bax inhibitor family protein|nr:Bax inhibitor-1/YccA family protein [Bifidobacteriaceae bacterium]